MNKPLSETVVLLIVIEPVLDNFNLSENGSSARISSRSKFLNSLKHK